MSRPSRFRLTTAWLQILLVGGLACVVLILTEAFRAARSSQRAAEHALQDYADFAAFAYGQHLTTRMREAVGELLGPVNHGDGLHESRNIPDARQAGHSIAMDLECNCHVPRHGPVPKRFVGFTLGSDTLSVGANLAKPDTRGWLTDYVPGATLDVPAMMYTPDEARWVNRLLTNVARAPTLSCTWRGARNRRTTGAIRTICGGRQRRSTWYEPGSRPRGRWCRRPSWPASWPRRRTLSWCHCAIRWP